MRSLESLIQLYKFQLDDKKKKLADVRDMAAQLALSLDTLEQQLLSEQILASTNPVVASSFAAYCQSIVQRKKTLLESAVWLEQEIQRINNDILEAFQELKRTETVHKQRLAASSRKRARKEAAQADETALRRYAVR